MVALHVPTKICTNPKCRKELPATPDYFARQKLGKYGLRSRCKECTAEANRLYQEANKSQISEKSRAYYQANRDETIASNRYRKTFWTPERHEIAFRLQKGQCFVCGREMLKTGNPRDHRIAAADHCHELKRPCALLCQECNLGGGKFGDNPELLFRFAIYRMLCRCQHLGYSDDRIEWLWRRIEALADEFDALASACGYPLDGPELDAADWPRLAA
jgi:5-methylcytosine-specific restriction endonuclease McrA